MSHPSSSASGLPGLCAAVHSAHEPPRGSTGSRPGLPPEPRGPSVTFNVSAARAGAGYGVPAPAPSVERSQPALPPTPDDRSPTGPVGQLVEAAKAGDTEAFAALYDRYLDTVYRYVYYRVGSRQLAEDLTSETFLRALRRIGTFTWQGRDFAAWLVTIARNLVADHFKSSRFRLEITTADMVAAESGDEATEGPEHAVMRAWTNATLLEALKRLNPQQQECLVLRFLQGLSVAETARVMGKNEGAIKTLQYRAVRTLAAILPEETA
ncbi:MAG TPA: ECF subfamily RNA polymerase sigma factor, BldN family [Sporichthyaceae bacterium]|jgi:RNA polymerase sigma-70 factor (ECF subfamily)|nr:ECF subfamily RNA polymerase sigma factor, BldN family [Sporichthyaceae bacterium]